MAHTAGNWEHACDSYGKVRHSRKACVYTIIKGKGGDRIETVAARIPNWEDAKLFRAAKDMYTTLKYMNHVPAEEGYCICPLNDGSKPDSQHTTSCADARYALRRVESDDAIVERT